MKILEQVRKGYPLKDLLVIDCHGHLGPASYFHVPWSDAPGMLTVMDRLGIDTVCISPTVSFADYRLGNDLSKKVTEDYAGRFLRYVVINPNYPNEIEVELERCDTQDRPYLIKIHPSGNAYVANGSNYRAMWDWANQNEAIVLSHTWFDKYCDPSIFDQLALEYPQVKIILAHCGSSWEGFEHSIEVVKKRDTVYLDLTSPFVYFGLVEYFVKKVGADRILWGSDIPFLDASSGLGKVVYARIKDEDKEKILGLNMKKLLGRD